MKDIVFIPFIDNNDGRAIGYRYGIESWKYWCKKNDCELIIFDTPIMPVRDMKVTWQRYFLFEMLENSEIEYNQILMVDCDTIVHPDCPNFFLETDNKYCGVVNDGSYEWTIRGIENYSKLLFNGHNISWMTTINGGFQIVNKSHRDFFKYITDYYLSNQQRILEVQNFSKTGSDQIALNFFLSQHNIDVKVLPYVYNMMEMSKKEIIDFDFSFIDLGWIYHFNSDIPKVPDENEDEYWMRETYKRLYNGLTEQV